MPVSQEFSTLVRRVILAFGLIAIGLTVGDVVSPHREAAAQGSGTVGIQTNSTPVFSNQATSAHSAIFVDNGFAANYLYYCTTAFSGTINLEWQPPLQTVFKQVALAKYPSATPDTGCHTLQLGGYYPNLRSSVTRTAGTISAWYTASSAPIDFFASGIGTNGATSPIVCDHSIDAVIASGNGSFTIGPLSTGDSIIICNATVSFNGAPSAGSNYFFWDSSLSCVSGVVTWQAFTTSSTPQYFTVPIPREA